MEHPCWKAGVEADVRGQDHADNRDASEKVYRCNSLVHLFGFVSCRLEVIKVRIIFVFLSGNMRQSAFK